MNVSSVVIKTAPENLSRVLESLEASGVCEVYLHDESGKIVVTIEGRSTGEEMTKMRAILDLPHVLSATLAYSYCGDEPGNNPSSGP